MGQEGVKVGENEKNRKKVRENGRIFVTKIIVWGL